MKIRHRKQLCFPVLQPLTRRRALALRAVAITATVEGNVRVAARAVLQFSMALITLSWARLTWPALALRHAGPQSRKMSATSRAGRDMTVGDLYRRLGPVSRQSETIQWAHHHTDRVGGYPRVERRRVEPGMHKRSYAIVRILLSY